MPIIKPRRVLLALGLLAAAGIVWADDPKTDSTASVSTATIVVVGTAQDTSDCQQATPERARWLADQASRDGAYQRAGQCYLLAGEQALADRAFVKAVAHTGADSSRKLSANLDEVKAQARQMKQVFHRL